MQCTVVHGDDALNEVPNQHDDAKIVVPVDYYNNYIIIYDSS